MALYIALSLLLTGAAAYPSNAGVVFGLEESAGFLTVRTTQDKAGLFGAVSVMEKSLRDLESSPECTDVIVIFARGTSEAEPIGDRVGSPLKSELTDLFSSDKMNKTLTFTGVNNYPANLVEFVAGGSPSGSDTMAEQLTTAAQTCPNAAIVSVGYSQGAQLVHNSIKRLSAAVLKRVTAIVTFGDPDRSQGIEGVPADDILIICHSDDVICDGNLLLDLLLYRLRRPEHLNYYQDVGAAAEFISARV